MKKDGIKLDLSGHNWISVQTVYFIRGFDRQPWVSGVEVDIKMQGVWIKEKYPEEKIYFVPAIHIERIEE